jgi:hypothetical protein
MWEDDCERWISMDVVVTYFKVLSSHLPWGMKVAKIGSKFRNLQSHRKTQKAVVCRTVTDWLAGWLAGWLTDRPTDLLTGWLAGWLTVWLTDRQIYWLTDWPADFNKLTGWRTYRLIDWLAGWLTDWLRDWLTDRLTYWFTIWPADWLTDWLAGWVTDWLTDWMADRLTETDLQTEWLTGWLADWPIDRPTDSHTHPVSLCLEDDCSTWVLCLVRHSSFLILWVCLFLPCSRFLRTFMPTPLGARLVSCVINTLDVIHQTGD